MGLKTLTGGDYLYLILYGGKTIESEYSINAANYLKEHLSNLKNFRFVNVNDIVTGNLAWKNVLSDVDAVLSIVYGNPGQTGEIPGILELYNIPYVGSGLISSALIKDKLLFNQICKINGINVPNQICIGKSEYMGSSEVLTNLNYPVITKPRSMGGLSLGISYCKNKIDLIKGMKDAFLYDDFVLIEEYIDGIEISACVLKNSDQIECLPLIEMKKETAILNYEAKTQGTCKKVVPACISSSEVKMVSNEVINVFNLFEMKDWGYFDLVLKDSKVYIIEGGTVPGLTSNSNLVIALKNKNYTLDRIINMLLESQL